MIEDKNPDLDKVLNPEDSGLKELVVDYIGNKFNHDTDEVTVEMAVEVFASEFSELILVLAEENFVRGYRQAFADLEAGQGAGDES
tara:strand:- start:706 stop:963 length:258 start_codon:yes stop_codon:yes gene_type:complete